MWAEELGPSDFVTFSGSTFLLRPHHSYTSTVMMTLITFGTTFALVAAVSVKMMQVAWLHAA